MDVVCFHSGRQTGLIAKRIPLAIYKSYRQPCIATRLSAPLETTRTSDTYSCPHLSTVSLSYIFEAAILKIICNESKSTAQRRNEFRYAPLDDLQHAIRVLRMLPELSAAGLVQSEMIHFKRPIVASLGTTSDFNGNAYITDREPEGANDNREGTGIHYTCLSYV